MTLELVPLGTNGFYPSYARQTMSFLVRSGNDALLLDAGTGVGRLFTSHPQLLAGVERLDILLTHYHLDHTAGLAVLSHAWRKPLVLHLPEEPLVDTSSGAEALRRLLSPPLFPLPLDRFAATLEIRPYSGASLRLLGLPVDLRRQQHPGGSVGVRLGDALAYITDTAADSATVDFCRGVVVLLHETWVTDAEARENPRLLTGHAAIADVLHIAGASAARCLMPVHHQPKRTPADLQAMIEDLQRRADSQVVLGDEGQPYPLDAF